MLLTQSWRATCRAVTSSVPDEKDGSDRVVFRHSGQTATILPDAVQDADSRNGQFGV